MALSSDQIAEKFSKGKSCQFWLTKKQASWLLNVWQRENKNAGSHFGRIQAGGQFENSNGFFTWEANEGNYETALFKCKQLQEQKTEKHPLEVIAEKRGLILAEIADPELMNSLIEELNKSRK